MYYETSNSLKSTCSVYKHLGLYLISSDKSSNISTLSLLMSNKELFEIKNDEERYSYKNNSYCVFN